VVSSENFDAKAGDEKDKLSLTQTVTITGLAYSTDELNKVLDGLVKNFVPEGYTMSSKSREISVEVLGNSDTTILSPIEADLQVTLKTFVLPDIQTDKLKDELLGKKLSDAEVILGKVRNIKTYEINISNSIPFLKRVPRKAENVKIEIVTNE
jgi:hypothetical protein